MLDTILSTMAVFKRVPFVESGLDLLDDPAERVEQRIQEILGDCRVRVTRTVDSVSVAMEAERDGIKLSGFLSLSDMWGTSATMSLTDDEGHIIGWIVDSFSDPEYCIFVLDSDARLDDAFRALFGLPPDRELRLMPIVTEDDDDDWEFLLDFEDEASESSVP